MNRAKYLSYKEAWERIPRAIEADYPFEAVTIIESIISDRLLSYLNGAWSDSARSVRTPFGTLIREWEEVAIKSGDSEALHLVKCVDEWRQQRNSVVHGLVKSEPGTPTEEVETFLEAARACAESGRVLARKVDAWHKRELRKAKKEKEPS